MNLISCEKLEKSMVEIQFSIVADTFKNAVAAAFKREGKKYAIPGFRKGKAPRHMIEKMYGADIFHYDAINDLFPENYEAAVQGSQDRNRRPSGARSRLDVRSRRRCAQGQGRCQARSHARRLCRLNVTKKGQDCGRRPGRSRAQAHAGPQRPHADP